MTMTMTLKMIEAKKFAVGRLENVWAEGEKDVNFQKQN